MDLSGQHVYDELENVVTDHCVNMFHCVNPNWNKMQCRHWKTVMTVGRNERVWL